MRNIKFQDIIKENKKSHIEAFLDISENSIIKTVKEVIKTHSDLLDNLKDR